MLTHTSRWSHARGNGVVPSRWQATPLVRTPAAAPTPRLITALTTKGTHSGRRSDTRRELCGKHPPDGREASDRRGGSLPFRA